MIDPVQTGGQKNSSPYLNLSEEQTFVGRTTKFCGFP